MIEKQLNLTLSDIFITDLKVSATTRNFILHLKEPIHQQHLWVACKQQNNMLESIKTTKAKFTSQKVVYSTEQTAEY